MRTIVVDITSASIIACNEIHAILVPTGIPSLSFRCIHLRNTIWIRIHPTLFSHTCRPCVDSYDGQNTFFFLQKSPENLDLSHYFSYLFISTGFLSLSIQTYRIILCSRKYTPKHGTKFSSDVSVNTIFRREAELCRN